MSVNNINNVYSKLLSSITNKITGKVNDSNNVSNTTTSNNNSLADTLELGSNIPDLSSYLNYNASGNYTLPSLTDGTDTDENSLLDMLKSEGNSEPSLTDYLNNDNSTDLFGSSSGDGMFDALIQENTAYTDLLIQQALNKLNTSNQSAGNNSSGNKSTSDKTTSTVKSK